MSRHSAKDSLRGIQIAAYTAVMTYEGYLGDTKTQDAVICRLEIIREETKKLSAKVRVKGPDVPWNRMAGLTDRQIHQCFGVNLDAVWHIVSVELADLALQVAAVIWFPTCSVLSCSRAATTDWRKEAAT